jgi:peroxiredoxin
MKRLLFIFLFFSSIFFLLGDKAENSARIREFLKAGKMEDALTFTEKCLKHSEDKEFYLGWKLALLKITKQMDRALDCALVLEKFSGGKKVSSAFTLAELSLQKGNRPETLKWMARAADRGLKDLRFFGEEKWATIKKEPEYKDILKQGIGRPAPAFSIELLDGEKFSLAGMKEKVVLIDFWATWCKPCTKTIPALKDYYNKFNRKGFEIIGVSLDRNPETLKKFMEEEKIPWPVSCSGQEWGQDKVAKLYGVEMIPVTFLVDRNGILRFYNLKESELEQTIQDLLEE